MAVGLPWLLLAGAGLLAGYINAVAGAGSLLTLPALILSGLDANAANATNRIPVLVQGLVAAWTYRRAGMRLDRRGMAACGVAAGFAAMGALCATLVGEQDLRLIIVVAMGVFLVLSFVRRGPAGDEGTAPREPAATLAVRPPMFVGLGLLGLYAGFLQAGVGVLFLLYMWSVHRADLLPANHLKVWCVLTLTVVALGVFVAAGEQVDLTRGAAVSVASALGAHAGARHTLVGGQRLIRAVLVVAVLGSAVALLWF